MKWLIGLPVLLVMCIVVLTIYLQPNDFLGCGERPDSTTQCGAADAIVVVSGGDTQARTQAGIDLYQNGWASALILSGAAQDTSGPSNAAAMKQQALASGVPEGAILIDEEARNTQQNAENAQNLITENGYGDVILVTSGYHQRRADLEFEKRASGVEIRNYPIQDSDWHWFWWLTPRGWWLAGGEMAKIIAFYLGVSS